MNELTTIEAAIRAGTHHQAFPIFESLPPGCTIWPVQGTRHEPHLHEGEWAVVDCNDRTISHGEVYLLRQGRGATIWQVCNETEAQRQSRCDPSGRCVWLKPLDNPRSAEDAMRRVMAGRRVHMSDGPAQADWIASLIIGRVVGMYEPEQERAGR